MAFFNGGSNSHKIESIDEDSNYVIENAGEENVIFGGEGLAEHLFIRGYDVELMIIDQSVKPKTEPNLESNCCDRLRSAQMQLRGFCCTS